MIGLKKLVSPSCNIYRTFGVIAANQQDSVRTGNCPIVQPPIRVRVGVRVGAMVRVGVRVRGDRINASICAHLGFFFFFFNRE